MNEPTSAGIRTVLNLADQVVRMREQADELIENFQTGHRGYFTPTEDVQVTRLWTSYHKARSALLDTIACLRSEWDDKDHRDSRSNVSDPNLLGEFLVGYASALILVDAARSLRDRFAEDVLVRRKLNESYERFGIAAGSFDAIQLSLTRPAHAVAVHDAGQFFQAHLSTFRELAQDIPDLAELIHEVESLREMISVTAAHYIRSRLADRRNQVGKQIIGGGATKAVYAIQQWGSRLVSGISTNPSHVPMIPRSIAQSIQGLLCAGDVLVSRKECAVTNYFLPGFWPHAAMYVGDDQVVESLKDGVRVRGMDSPFGNDCLAVLRPLLDPCEIQMAIERALQHVGKPYDFDFDFTRSDRMVCTEVVYRSYEGIGSLKFRLTQRAGRHTLSAEDLLMMAMQSQHFDIIAVYCPSHDQCLLQGEEASRILQATVALHPT